MHPILRIGSVSGGYEMGNILERIMNRYGTEMVWIHDGKEEALRGFLQPVTSRSWQKLLREVSPLGAVSTGLYVYFGPVSRELQGGDLLSLGRRQYQVRRTERIYDRSGPAYLWALCVQKGGD